MRFRYCTLLISREEQRCPRPSNMYLQWVDRQLCQLPVAGRVLALCPSAPSRCDSVARHRFQPWQLLVIYTKNIWTVDGHQDVLESPFRCAPAILNWWATQTCRPLRVFIIKGSILLTCIWKQCEQKRKCTFHTRYEFVSSSCTYSRADRTICDFSYLQYCKIFFSAS